MDCNLPPPLEPPTISSLTFVAANLGGSIRVELAAGAGNQAAGAVYGFEIRIDGDDDWQAQSPIQPFFAEEPGQSTQIVGFATRILPETNYEVRVRAEASGRVSPWVTGTVSTPEFVVIINAGVGP
jgi:hypothetical protein